MSVLDRILYVDDEPSLLELGRMFLEQAGDFKVTTALSADAAIRLLEQEHFDAIISDYQMPGMDGIQFLVVVRKRFGQIPFILFTGRGREEVVIQAINSGADSYLQKGGEPNSQFAELAHSVSSAISRKKADAALRESEETFKTLFESAGAAIFTTDHTLFLDCNRKTEEMFRCSRDQIIGHSPIEFSPEHQPDGRLSAEIIKVKMDAAFLGEEQFFDWVHTRHDGTLFNAQITLNRVMVQGTYHLQAIIQDITERKRADEELLKKNEELAASGEELKSQFDALAESEHTTRFLVEQLVMSQDIGHNGSWLYNVVTDTTWGSAEAHRLFGFPPVAGDFPMADKESCIPERERIHQALIDLIHAGKEYNFEYLIYPADGSAPKVIHSIARLEKDAQGNPIRVVGVFQDITDRKQAEEALVRKNQELESSHEQLTASYEALRLNYEELTRKEQALKESEERYRGLADTIISGVAIYEVRNDGASGNDYIIKDFNSTALGIEGKTKEEVIGRSLLDLRPTIDDYGLIPVFRRVWKTGIPEFFPQTIYTDNKYTSWYENRVFRMHNGDIVAVYDDVTVRIRAELALKAALAEAQRFRDALDHVSSYIYLKDRQSRYVYANRQTLELFGCSAEELVGSDDTRFFPPDAVKRIREEDKRVFAGEKSEVELEVSNAKGGRHVYWDVKSPIYADAGHTTLWGLCGVATDITERKRVEEALKESEEKFRQLFTRMPSAVAIYNAVDDGGDFIFRDFNSAAEKIEGIKKDDLIGKRVTQVFPGVKDLGIIPVFQRVWRTGQPEFFPQALYRDEHDLDTWRESWIYKLASGEIVAIYNDITERKRTEDALFKKAEELHAAFEELTASVEELRQNVDDLSRSERALRKSEDLLKRTGEIARVGGWELDAETLAVTWTDETYRIHEVPIGQVPPLEDTINFFHPDERKKLSDAIERALTTGEGYDMELRFITATGKQLWCRTLCQPKVIDGKTIRLIGTFQDITERKRAEEALKESGMNLKEAQRVGHLGSWDLNVVTGDLQWSDESYRIYGFRPQEFVPTYEKFQSIVHPEDLGFVQEQIDAALDNDKHYDIDFRFVRPDGETGWIHCEGEVTRDAEGRPIRFFGTQVDITKRKRDEEALKESEENFKELAENANDGILVAVDDEGHTYANRQACEITGFSVTELQKTGMKDLAAPDEIENLRELLRKRLAGEEISHSYETVIIRKDGIRVPIELSGAKTFWHGQPADLVIVRDITGRKRAEEVLKESEEKYRLLSESSPDHVIIMDPGLRYLYVLNPQLDLSSEDMIGKTDYDIMSKEDADKLTQIKKQILETGKTIRYETSLISVKGKKEFFDGVFIPKYNKDGKIDGLMGYFRNVTDSKRAEEALCKERNFAESIVRTAQVIVLILDTNGHILYLNPYMEEISGYTLEEVKGKDWFETFLPPDIQESIRTLFKKAIGNSQTRGNIDAIITRDGRERLIEWYDTTLKSADGSIEGLLAIGQDVTERKRADDVLREAKKKLALLSGITRHDINNQLMVLQGYLTILEKKESDPALNVYFGNVATAVQRIAAMIQFTKEYEQIGVNAPAWQDCRTLVDTAAKQAPLGNVMVKNDLPAGTEVFADPLVVKVFYNLMENAARYGKKITSIRFSVEERDGDHVVICEDDGNGVPAEEKEKIFERGFGKNTGLGLTLSKEILDITGITIRETGQPGQGARFEMTVPKGMYRFADP